MRLDLVLQESGPGQRAGRCREPALDLGASLPAVHPLVILGSFPHEPSLSSFIKEGRG